MECHTPATLVTSTVRLLVRVDERLAGPKQVPSSSSSQSMSVAFLGLKVMRYTSLPTPRNLLCPPA